MYKVTIADIVEMTEEVIKVELNTEIVTYGTLSSKIVTTITITGQISFDSDKLFMLNSAKAIADWSLTKPGSDDTYKKVSVEFVNTGQIRYELMDAFVISYHEWIEDQIGFFKLIIKQIKPDSKNARPGNDDSEKELPGDTQKENNRDVIKDAHVGSDSLLTKNESALPYQESLLGKNGIFIDSTLESNYQKYRQRKLKEGIEPRDRLDWKKVCDYWLDDSPMARGNRFNKVAVKEDWYVFNEIHLANGKRLDSYAPPPPPPGEIISRKATDIDEIEEDTYRQYLSEMNTKYPSGTTIRSNKYRKALDGKKLEGKQILEIPDSNLNSKNIDKYKQIAAEYGIELRFKGE